MSKKETVNLIDTFSEFKELKSIDRSTLISVMEESFRSVIAKMFGSDDNYDVIINPDKGDFEIYRNRTVVEDEELEDDNLEIPLTQAKKIDEDYEVGEEVTDTVDFMGFGRRAILNLRQTLASKILELQKENVFSKPQIILGIAFPIICLSLLEITPSLFQSLYLLSPGLKPYFAASMASPVL